MTVTGKLDVVDEQFCRNGLDLSLKFMLLFLLVCGM